MFKRPARFIVPAGLALLACASAAQARDPLNIQGQLALWQRPVCKVPDCKQAEPNGVFWDVGLSLQPPTDSKTPGTTTKEVTNGPWAVRISFYWVQPSGENAKDYVVTQLRLSHEKLGFLAECSRYDTAQDIEPFPVGACSGAAEATQYGVSLVRSGSPLAR